MNTPPMHTDHLAHEEHDLSTATSLACFVGFRHARERLLAQFSPVAPVVAPTPEARQAAGRLARLTGCAHPLKTSLAWLSSAAALGGVLLGILSR